MKWLAAHQDLRGDGRWDCDEFFKHDPADDKSDGPGKALYDPGATGLALMAFLGAGYTDRGAKRDNPYARNVRMGLRYLVKIQDGEGCFGSRSPHRFIYNHAIATLAMCEAWSHTHNPRYRRPAQAALDFIAGARNPQLAWRYGLRGGDNDTSVTGWMIMALRSGKDGGLRIDPAAFAGTRRWIDKSTDDTGDVSYVASGGSVPRPWGLQDRFPARFSASTTAIGILSRILLGENPKQSRMVRRGAQRCLERPPRWDPERGTIDMYYWYYATLALHQVGGRDWKNWNENLKRAVLHSQNGSGARAGSWDPIGAWGHEGGRVYATALMVLCLEVYYRYDRVFGAF